MSAEEHRFAAYWFWGAHLPPGAEMRRQLEGFREAGFSRIYIQARPSMPLGLYLSPAYLSHYREAVEIMADLGLRAGLYDDYAWTSGQAGGRTVDGADHLRERHLFWAVSSTQEAQISGITATLGASLGPAVRDWIHEGGRPVCADWELVAAVILMPDGRALEASARLTSTCDTGVTARLDTLPGGLPDGARWICFAATRIASSRVINYLLPEAGARFVTVGLEPYARALEGLLPGVVDQLFFDQPAPVLYRWNETEGNLLNSFLWSEGFADAIRARGAIGPQLAALLFDTGPQTSATRSFVWRLYTRLIAGAFFAPLRDFCDRNGLELTGHEILPHVASFALNGGFSSIDPRVAMAVDFFGLDHWRDITAVDVNNLGPQLAPMLGQSISRASGRKTCLAELYLTAERSETRAAGQWEITPASLRAQAIRLHLLGASQIILHALYAESDAQSGDAAPEPLANMRFDFAPGYNLQPWWGVMRELCDETAALAEFIAGAEPVWQVALLYPLETALTEGPRHDHAACFGTWAEALWRAGHPPLIIDEAGLAQISRGPEGPELYGSRLAALILPEVTGFADEASEGRCAALNIPLWHGAPADAVLPDFLAAQEGPQITPVPGLTARILGRDGEGWWRLVLFNEGEIPVSTSLTFGTSFRQEGCEGVLSLRKLRLEPGELLCLRLAAAEGPGDERTDQQPARIVQVLDSGWTMQIGDEVTPVDVRRGWEQQGHADYSGIGVYETWFDLDKPATPLLDLPGLACAARVFVNGADQGQVWHPPFRIALGRLPAGRHHLRLEIANTGANRFYAGTPFAAAAWPDPSGLTAPPLLLLPSPVSV